LICSANGLADDEEQINHQEENRESLEMLASTFPTVEVLEVHKNLRNLVFEIVYGKTALFPGLKELWVCSKDERRMMYFVNPSRGSHHKS